MGTEPDPSLDVSNDQVNNRFEARTAFLEYRRMPGKLVLVHTEVPAELGIRHSVNVQAETLYEAVVLAIRALREHDCAPGAASHLEVEARSPSVTHTVSMAKVQTWLASSAKSPSEKS